MCEYLTHAKSVSRGFLTASVAEENFNVTGIEDGAEGTIFVFEAGEKQGE